MVVMLKPEAPAPSPINLVPVGNTQALVIAIVPAGNKMVADGQPPVGAVPFHGLAEQGFEVPTGTPLASITPPSLYAGYEDELARSFRAALIFVQMSGVVVVNALASIKLCELVTPDMLNMALSPG